MDNSEAPDKHSEHNENSGLIDKRHLSLSSLIMWNISKALEKNPNLDLRCALRSTLDCLEQKSRDVNTMISQCPQERHITCAVLAWQQLGHKDADSLYEFVESHRKTQSRNASEKLSKKDNVCSANSIGTTRRPKGFIDHKPSVCCGGVESASFDTRSLIGPVLKIPVEAKVVMRVKNTSPCARHNAKKSAKTQKNDITNKVEACCLDSSCAEKLKELEKSTAELRNRAAQLARREAERVELLERAEAAWRDLELGYQRRLVQNEEKEDDIAKQIKKLIEDRNAYKQACTTLAQQLGKRAEIVENDRARLTQVEKEVCDLACTRLRLSEESAKGDAAVADQQCKVMQLERDLQFREEQARRKLLSIESTADSSRGLALEAERAMREELGSLKEQIAQVSNQLLEEDAENNNMKVELEELRQRKDEMIEDLEGCRQLCDNRMQDRVDVLNKKRQQLKELKDKVLDCQCKLPLDASVEVKRTPSLAALCQCTAEEKILHCCSCTSVRSTLMSNLLSDLFGGLQAELGETGSLMPCQLLKCLEDKHNWDRSSVVKSNLRSFFSRLLLGELNTAIATSIEKYHATWVGVSCADRTKMIPEPGEDESEGWQERALERRAQKLASQLAEQLFEERADELVQRAKNIVTSGPPPCECKPQTNKTTAYPCLIKAPTINHNSKRNEANYPAYFKKAVQDVGLLRTQIEDLKKETIKKEDLRIMEEKITKIVQRASGPDNKSITLNEEQTNGRALKQTIHKEELYIGNTERLREMNGLKCGTAIKKNSAKVGLIKTIRKTTDINKINGRLVENKLTGKSLKKMGQSYAVNLCLYDGKNNPDNGFQNRKFSDNLDSCEEKLSQGILAHISSTKYAKPILSKDNQNSKSRKKLLSNTKCSKNCKCFHKVPSNNSINKLLGTLVKWKGDLLNCSLFNTLTKSKSNQNVIQEIHHDSQYSNYKKSTDINKTQNIIDQNISIVHVTTDTKNNLVPPITTSEYVGAINLDKSDENSCKYTIEVKNESEMNEGEIVRSNNILYKCLNTSKSIRKSIENNIEKNCSTGSNVESKKVEDTTTKDKSVSLLDKSLNCENKSSNQCHLNEGCKSKILFGHKNNQTSDSDLITSDRDLLIKFLGVTVTDLNDNRNNSLKQLNKNISHAKPSNNHYNQRKVNSKFISTDKSDGASNKNKQFSEVQPFDGNTHYESKLNLYHFVDVPISKKDISQTKDKNNTLKEDQSNDLTLSDINSCVCCSDVETKNLEINTFYLLEKHLKYKLAELRKSSCNPSCILADEEEKVFGHILDRVKKVISDCTYNVKCECSADNKNSGSWIRVHRLLEEYLKMKIKRVQCSCTSNNENLDKVLPSILNQVSNLVQNDFERLKSLCMGKNKYDEKSCQSQSQLNVNIKDIHSPHLNSNELCKVRKNISIQDSRELEIEDKSCDAIELKETKDTHTSLSAFSFQLGSNEVIITHCYNLSNEVTINTCNNDDPIESKYEAVKIESQQEIHSNSRCNLSVPYIGCTLSSSYDNNIGSCIGSKPLSQTHVKTIDKIWKTIEINKKLLPNISYIMQSIPHKVPSENIINFVKVTEPSFVPVISEPLSTKIVNVSEDEEITLKHSDDKLKVGDINDNMTNTIDDLVSVTTECLNDDDDLLYWYDCCPSPRNARNEIIHKKAFYDSVYSPIVDITKRGKSDSSFKNNVTMCISRSKKCDCVMVPVCHVKKLVENIENKLANSQCTCDSLRSQICPLHSKMLKVES